MLELQYELRLLRISTFALEVQPAEINMRAMRWTVLLHYCNRPNQLAFCLNICEKYML